MLSKVPRTFKKGYLPRWTEEIFIVDRNLDSFVPTYKIKVVTVHQSKVRFTKKYKKVNSKEYTFFRIEKVLKKKDGKALVSWKRLAC